jgi:hypothetical protein
MDRKFWAAMLWESLPSSLQETIKKWVWEAVIGSIVLVAYLVWEVTGKVVHQPWEYIVALAFVFFTTSLYFAHFVKTRLFRIAQVTRTKEIHSDDETEIDRWHNNRKVPLRIEFVDNSEYKYIGEHTGAGIQRGHVQFYRIAVRNTTDRDIEEVQVWVTKISPMPDELRGCTPLPLHVTHSPVGEYTMLVPAKDKRLVDVVSFFDRFWSFNIRLEHTSTTAKQEIFQGGDGHEIELTVHGKQTKASSRRFKIGITNGNNKNLMMESLPQTEEEAFNEAAT